MDEAHRLPYEIPMAVKRRLRELSLPRAHPNVGDRDIFRIAGELLDCMYDDLGTLIGERREQEGYGRHQLHVSYDPHPKYLEVT